MTDEEYDLFFINLLKTILSDLEDTYNYNKNYSLPEYNDILENLELNINELKEVLNKITNIDDFSKLDYEIINLVYECIYDYASNFIISEEDRDKALEEYEKVEDILYMFVDEE